MTRVVILIIALGIFAVLMGITYYICYTTNHPYISVYNEATLINDVRVIAIEWISLAAMITALSTMIGVILWGKKINKKEELKDNQNDQV